MGRTKYPTVLMQAAGMTCLMSAVAKGVHFENGFYRFFDPGISLRLLQELPIVSEKKLMFNQFWGRWPHWVKQMDAPQERLIRIPVEGSFGNSFPSQRKLLSSDEQVAEVRVVVTFLVINALSTDKLLLHDNCVRCINRRRNGQRIRVGFLGAISMHIESYWVQDSHPLIGIASVRE